MDRYILVVDDDADVREILCEVIEEAGYRVAAAADGKAALDHLSKNPPPFLILLDLMMPVMDGRQFRLKQVQMPELASIPVAILSADGRADTLGDLRGATCLKKPIDLEHLLDVIEQHRQQDRRPVPEARPSP